MPCPAGVGASSSPMPCPTPGDACDAELLGVHGGVAPQDFSDTSYNRLAINFLTIISTVDFVKILTIDCLMTDNTL